MACGLILTAGCGWLRPGGPPEEAYVEISTDDVDELTIIISQLFLQVEDPECAGQQGCSTSLRIITADTIVASSPYTNNITFTNTLQLYVETYPTDEVEATVGHEGRYRWQGVVRRSPARSPHDRRRCPGRVAFPCTSSAFSSRSMIPSAAGPDLFGFVAARFRALLLLALAGCASIEAPLVEGEPGTPLPGLTDEQLLRFREGRALFGRAFTPEEGLGPNFNQARCVACHDLPESGGHGAEPVTRISHYDPDTGCDPLTRVGGGLLQSMIVPAMREAGLRPERTPAEASAVTLMFPPQLFGLGLVEAVAGGGILSRADPEDIDGDGISGRPGLAPDGRLARFGLRATHVTLESFIEEAIRGRDGPHHPGTPGRNSAQRPSRFHPGSTRLPTRKSATPTSRC